MQYLRSLNRNLLERCHRCEWSFEADDSEFPSLFVFDLRYQVCDGGVVLRSIDPQGVITRDDRGNPLFQHDFTDRERPQVWQWFHGHFNLLQDRLLDGMEAEIQQDRLARTEAGEATFQELARELARN